jgi:hypothetical protein
MAVVTTFLSQAGGQPLSSRGVRHVAEAAGAVMERDASSRSGRWWVPLGAPTLDDELVLRDSLHALRAQALAGTLGRDAYQSRLAEEIRRLEARHPNLTTPDLRAAITDRANDLARRLAWSPIRLTVQ